MSLYEARGLTTPKYLPEGDPRVLLDENPLTRRNDHPCGHNDEDNDGILYWYDQPLLFLAYVGTQRVLVTLTEEDYANDGMEDGYAKNARGWQQWIAVAIDDETLRKILANEIEIRAHMERGAETMFIHKDWCSLRVPDLDRWDKRQWYSVTRTWKDVPVQEEWKSDRGCTFDPEKNL